MPRTSNSSAEGSPEPSSWRSLLIVLAWPNNLVTLARIVSVALIVGSLALGARWNPLAGSALFMVAIWYTDTLDGWLARKLKRTSSFGESLDMFADCVCDLIVCSFLLVARPEYGGAVVFFLLGRFGPDVLVIRYGGLTPSVYAVLLQRSVQALLPTRLQGAVRKSYSNLAIEAHSLTKAVFYCGALFWRAPAWTGFLIVVPAVIFLALAGMVMRLHAQQVLAERAQARAP